MNIDGKQGWILGVLGVVLCVVWARAFTAGPARSRKPARQGQSDFQPKTDASPPISSATRYESWAESPFLTDRSQRPVGGVSEAAPSELILNGILWDPNAPSAIVNNRVVNIGDQLGPWRVAEIQKDRVILSDGTDTKTLQTE